MQADGMLVEPPASHPAATPAKTVLVIGAHPESLLVFRGPLLQAMLARGHHVVACASGASASVRERLAALGVRYVDLPLRRASLSPMQDVACLRALISLVRAVRPDTVLAYTIKPILYGGIAARLAGVRAFFAMIEGVGYAFAGHGHAARLAKMIARPLYRVSLAGAERVFFLNPDNLALFTRLGLLRSPRQAVLINGIGIDLQAFRPTVLPERPSFLLIARLLTSKGIAEYVEAARMVRAVHPEVRFRLVGWIDDHPEAVREADLRAWIAEGVIDYLGRLEDVRPAIADCSVYVLPSYHEGLPRTVLEAMAMGRAIITTDAPGCRETVVPGQNGQLVPVGDASALAAAMQEFLHAPERIGRAGAASRALATRKFDVHAVNEMILGVMRLTG